MFGFPWKTTFVLSINTTYANFPAVPWCIKLSMSRAFPMAISFFMSFAISVVRLAHVFLSGYWIVSYFTFASSIWYSGRRDFPSSGSMPNLLSTSTYCSNQTVNGMSSSPENLSIRFSRTICWVFLSWFLVLLTPFGVPPVGLPLSLFCFSWFQEVRPCRGCFPVFDVFLF